MQVDKSRSHSTSMETQSPPVGISRFISPKELASLVGVSKITLARMRARGEMPVATRLSRGRIGWPEGEIARWLESRRESRDVAGDLVVGLP